MSPSRLGRPPRPPTPRLPRPTIHITRSSLLTRPRCFDVPIPLKLRVDLAHTIGHAPGHVPTPLHEQCAHHVIHTNHPVQITARIQMVTASPVLTDPSRLGRCRLRIRRRRCLSAAVLGFAILPALRRDSRVRARAPTRSGSARRAWRPGPLRDQTSRPSLGRRAGLCSPSSSADRCPLARPSRLGQTRSAL